MEEQDKREIVTDTARQLLIEGLLVRTWGNISCRLDAERMIITPSGRSYENMKPEDLPVVNIADGVWSGPYKPSGERGVHREAYEIFPEAEFVIHTHQAYASAIAVYGIGELDITPEEHIMLGGLAQAGYGLPGTKKLTEEVRIAMKGGAHTVLMANHGVVIAAASMEEAIYRARLLEEICKRCVRGSSHKASRGNYINSRRKKVERYLSFRYRYLKCVTTDAVLLQAVSGKPITAQLDDMAQMIGRQIPVGHNSRQVKRALNKYHAVMVPGIGGFVAGADADDTEALAALLKKAAITARHTDALGEKVKLGAFDTALMHLVYLKKYSKQKNA